MEALTTSLLIGLGAACGANARYWIGGWIQARAGAVFPWQTLLVNVSGSLLIGLFMGIALQSGWPPNWRLFVSMGLLGGYTTYSTFAYEAVDLLSARSFQLACAYIFGTLAACLAGAWLGRLLARALAGG